MGIDSANEAKIVDSWGANAKPWIAAVRERQIESRQLVTDSAVANIIIDHRPRSVLDIGCGEEWLARAIAPTGIDVLGIDVVPSLVERAQGTGGGEFRVSSFEEIAAGSLTVSADVVVCNFSLFGKESVKRLFAVLATLLNADGVFIVQTLHPMVACSDLPYRDGWRDGSWAGFSAAFINPAPWYFRTLASWIELSLSNNLQLAEIREPLHPQTHPPASVIFIAKAAA